MYTLRISSKDYTINNQSLPMHPFIFDNKSRLCPICASYFFERQAMSGVSPGSVHDEAYIICGWMNFLNSKKLSWKEGSDELINAYKADLENRVALAQKSVQKERSKGSPQDRPPNKRRISRIISVIWRFYYIVEVRLGLISGIIDNPNNPTLFPHLPITVRAKVVSDTNGNVTQIRFVPPVGYATLPKRVNPARHTPDDEEVERVFEKVQEGPKGTMGFYASCSHYIAAGWMRQSGLRREGVAKLSIPDLEEALRDIGITRGLLALDPMDIIEKAGAPYQVGQDSNALDLRSMNLDFAGQAKLRQAFDTLINRRKKRHAFVVVVEKSKGPSMARVDLEFLWECLLFIWGPRAEFETKRNTTNSRRSSDHLLLSSKTGEGLRPKSIGNFLLIAFKDAGVKGSGHRLRAAFGTAVAKDSYARERARHGRGYDRASITLDVKEALRHESPDAQQAYVDRAIRDGGILSGEAILVADSKDASLLRALASRLESDDPAARSSLHVLAKSLGLEPIPEHETLSDVRKTIRQRLKDKRGDAKFLSDFYET